MKRILISLAVLAMVLSAQDLRSQDLAEIMEQITDAGAMATYSPEYKFDTYMKLEVSDLGDQNVIYNAYLTKDGSHYAVLFDESGANAVIIVDTKNKALLMLSENDGEKMGMAMSVDSEALADLTAEVEESARSYANFKTGKTKEILGYQCDEYLIEEEGTISRIWVSEELGKLVAKELLGNQQLFSGAFAHAAGLNGMVLEYVFTETSDGDSRTLKITKIDLNSDFTVKASEYTIMSMGQ